MDVLLKQEVEFAFFDATYAPSSDSGAYFSYSPSNSVWRMTFGNHGWSGGIYEIETTAVAINSHTCIQRAY
jgi:hypothetical protein